MQYEITLLQTIDKASVFIKAVEVKKKGMNQYS